MKIVPLRAAGESPVKRKRRRENPAFTFFADDVLAWEPYRFLTREQRGDVLDLIVYGGKLGGSLPADHPLLGSLDAKLIELCTRREGNRVVVVVPLDLPGLLADRQDWRESRRPGAEAADRGPDGRFRKRE
jgi:hypothetical protein